MAEDLSESFRRLSAQASSLKQIIDGIGEGIVAVDRHGNITQYNDNIFGVFGIDRTYATKMTPESFLETSRIRYFLPTSDGFERDCDMCLSRKTIATFKLSLRRS